MKQNKLYIEKKDEEVCSGLLLKDRCGDILLGETAFDRIVNQVDNCEVIIESK